MAMEVPPKSIQQIWDEFPTDVSKNDMQETLKLLKQNSSFGQENYVDLRTKRLPHSRTKKRENRHHPRGRRTWENRACVSVS